MTRAHKASLIALAILFRAGILFAEDQPARPALNSTLAVERGLRVIERGAANYPEHRQCFSCHNQTLPLLAMDATRKAGIAIDEKVFQVQVDFTHDAFARRHEDLNAGEGIGGKTLTVDYGLWALDLARWKADDTTTAMVAFLLKTQEPDGHWPRQSLRPPLSESVVTATVLAADFGRKYAAESQKGAVEAAIARAEKWLESAPLEVQEDFAFRLWGLKLLGGDGGVNEQKLRAARDAVLARQRTDGGWSQTTAMTSDAYATGESLFVLGEAGLSTTTPEYQRGVRFLLDTQKEDGSWLVETRSKPVQVFFDNGDPHGKHQFLSMAATAWAVTALAKDVPRAASATPATPLVK